MTFNVYCSGIGLPSGRADPVIASLNPRRPGQETDGPGGLEGSPGDLSPGESHISLSVHTKWERYFPTIKKNKVNRNKLMKQR